MHFSQVIIADHKLNMSQYKQYKVILIGVIKNITFDNIKAVWMNVFYKTLVFLTCVFVVSKNISVSFSFL